MFCDPSSNALADAEFQAVEQLLMWIFRGTQNQVLVFQNIDETGIAFDDFNRKVQNPVKRLMKTISAGYMADGLVQDIYM